MIEPRKILVCGGGELPQEFTGFSQNLGKALMKQTRCTLITGGLRSRKEGTVANDYVIAQAAMDELKSTGEDPATRIQTILPKKESRNVLRFNLGNTIVVPNTDSRRRRYSMTLMCDVMISIGGGEITADIIDLAWLAGKPILPIPATRGASRDAWEKYGADIAKKLNITADEAKIIGKQTVANKMLVSLCIKALNRALRPQCFVAMPFEKHPLPNVYETIRAAVEEKGYQAVRVDKLTAVGNLTEAIWDGIRAAQVTVADLTDENPNVYYEVGISHALGRPTLLTVFDKNGKLPPDLPFDISHDLVLPYGTVQSLRIQLDRHLPAV